MLSLVLVTSATGKIAPLPTQSLVSSLFSNNVTHTGSAAYTGEFKTAPQNGVYLNVWVKNIGSSSVFIDISRNGLKIIDGFELSSGSQKTINFEDMLGNGLSGDWKVYIYNKTGDKYNLTINARQFD